MKGVMLFRAHRYASDSPQLNSRVLEEDRYDELNKKRGILK